MKKKTIIGLFCSLLGLGVTTTSCEDMLTPDMDRYVEGFSGRDTVNFYFGILSDIQDVVENNILLGEIRGDLVDTTGYVSDSIAKLAEFTKVADGENGLLNRAGYYKIINQCNYYLATCDTVAQKNNIFYMRREYAQVQLMRAWTYMQLVQNYGSVPFITSPVTNAHTGWETNPEGGFVTSDNLLDKLLQHGLQSAYEYEKTYGTPSYGAMENGKSQINASLCVFPADVILGDLYLLRGQNKADFEKAAQYYYTYIDEQTRMNTSRLIKSVSLASKRGMEPNQYYSFFGNGSSWASSFMDAGSSPSVNAEIVTMIPSAANSSMGTVLTRAAQIYGFDPVSTSHTTTTYEKDENGVEKPVYNTTGTISLTANYKSRQLGASRRYEQLNSSQYYVVPKDGNRVISSPTEDLTSLDIKSTEIWTCGDGRRSASERLVQTPGGRFRFINKRALPSSSNWSISGEGPTNTGSFQFNYVIPIYRMRQVYLRYAEAVNRAGFPRYAFAILRDGLSSKKIPAVRYDSVQNGKVFPYRSTIANGADIDVNELRRASEVTWLDFSEARWNGNLGIHQTGCFTGFDLDTLYCYDNMVAQRIAQEKARVDGLSTSATAKLAKRLKVQLKDESEGNPEGGETGSEGDGTVTDPQPADAPTLPENIGEQINAVESLIADEMALETAFEGSRYYDLYRIARHKNKDTWNFAGGDYGTKWFAWSIARRSTNLLPYAQPTQFNHALYSKLLNEDNWYLENPKY